MVPPESTIAPPGTISEDFKARRMALYMPFRGCSSRFQLPCSPHLSPVHVPLGLRQPRGPDPSGARRAECCPRGVRARQRCSHIQPLGSVCPFFFNHSAQGLPGEPQAGTPERRPSRGAGELLTCTHPRGGGAGARRGRGAGPPLLRSLPRGSGISAPGGASGSGAGMEGAILAPELAHTVLLLLLSLFPAGGSRGRGRARSPAGPGAARAAAGKTSALAAPSTGQRRSGGRAAARSVPGIAPRCPCGTPRWGK